MYQPQAHPEGELAVADPAAREIDEIHVQQANQARQQVIARAAQPGVYGTQRKGQQCKVKRCKRQCQPPHDL